MLAKGNRSRLGVFTRSRLGVFLARALRIPRWAWGQSGSYRFGIGPDAAIDPSAVLEPLEGEKRNYVLLSGGEQSGFAITRNGNLYGWGLNSSGQVGVGNTDPVPTPTLIGQGGWKKVMVTQYNAIAEFTLGIKNGDLYIWGYAGASPNRLTPTLIDEGGWTDIFAHATDAAGIKNGNWMTIALATGNVSIFNDDRTWAKVTDPFVAVGLDSNGKLYDSDDDSNLDGTWKDFDVAGSQNAIIALSAADNKAYLSLWGGFATRWGAFSKQSDIEFESISAGKITAFSFDHFIALTKDHNLYSWGRNGAGQLGLGDTDERLEPDQIAGKWRVAVACPAGDAANGWTMAIGKPEFYIYISTSSQEFIDINGASSDRVRIAQMTQEGLVTDWNKFDGFPDNRIITLSGASFIDDFLIDGDKVVICGEKSAGGVVARAYNKPAVAQAGVAGIDETFNQPDITARGVTGVKKWDGKYVIVGRFVEVNETARVGIAILENDGTLNARTFATAYDVNRLSVGFSVIGDAAYFTDGLSDFVKVDLATGNEVWRIDDLRVRSVDVLDGVLYCACLDRSDNTYSIKRITTSGVIEWSTSLDEWAVTLRIIGGFVYIGGGFTNVGGTAKASLARLDPSNGNLDSWSHDTESESLTGGVRRIAESHDKKYLYVMGAWTATAGINYFTRIKISDGSADWENVNTSGLLYALASD